ncbi:hypothetical protein DICPUDRAFT_79487 [Dictyostelium purpureum]|uniref:Uncharacterized protein n=1 Tax=Dictyostelium purpureum TaxID=5786 RepID=F0ZMQ9_DICPU|nr:uncharacterized protein DICPUDRAFT_79487 [Dictyostelium purpureum]EGC34789.1 hypothetical protein DICPUDRAFT_79487 [Dictyostelium purpureum]|eukprot:XP_003288704.1 hypothetical protein DICPUDRAFT_79487 [Dictyostelium purpureum]
MKNERLGASHFFNELINESNRLLEFANNLFKISSDEIAVILNDKNKKLYLEILKSNLRGDNEDYCMLLEYESIINKKRKELIYKNNIDSFKIETQIKDYQKKFNQLFKEINLKTLNFMDTFLSIPHTDHYDLFLNSLIFLIKIALKIKLKLKLNQLFWSNQLNSKSETSSDNFQYKGKNEKESTDFKFEFNYLINYDLDILDNCLKNEIKKISLNWLSIVFINYMSLKNIKQVKENYKNDLLVSTLPKETNTLVLSNRKEVCEKIEQFLFKQNEIIDINF